MTQQVPIYPTVYYILAFYEGMSSQSCTSFLFMKICLPSYAHPHLLCASPIMHVPAGAYCAHSVLENCHFSYHDRLLFQVSIDKAFHQEILQLDVKCNNTEWGCKWEGKFNDVIVSHFRIRVLLWHILIIFSADISYRHCF